MLNCKVGQLTKILEQTLNIKLNISLRIYQYNFLAQVEILF